MAAHKFSSRELISFRRRLLTWFRRSRREFAWRASRDPYRIWVAEIMLQQTRIAAVVPYYDRFMLRFPTVDQLAEARPQEVLKLWSGLGYYSRARNLHRTARQIVERHSGEFPRNVEAVLALPGIGHYTAAAVLSIAHDVPLAALDGNIARVLARLEAVRGDLREPARWRELKITADSLLARHAAGDWNQGLMELGETICTPQNPKCGQCPISNWCQAYLLGLTEEIPAPRKKRSPVDVHIAAAVLTDPQGRTLLVRDPGAHDSVLFSRMWQFPAIAVTSQPQMELARHLDVTLGLTIAEAALTPLSPARHGVTFRNITLLPFLIQVPQLPKFPRTRILALNQLRKLPVSSATRKIAAAAEVKSEPHRGSRQR